MALKKTSENITINTVVEESALDTFTVGVVDLALDPLSNEVFVITGVELSPEPIKSIQGGAESTQTRSAYLYTQNRTSPSLSTGQLVAWKRTSLTMEVINAGGAVNGVLHYSETGNDAGDFRGDWLAISATPDLYLCVQSSGAIGADTCQLAATIYGYRAKADAATYAALVQSELLSS